MFNIFKKKPQGSSVTFAIDGMHCTSCSMNIDGELEDTQGVISSDTSYAQATTSIVYDSGKVSKETLKGIIEKLEYTVKEIS